MELDTSWEQVHKHLGFKRSPTTMAGTPMAADLYTWRTDRESILVVHFLEGAGMWVAGYVPENLTTHESETHTTLSEMDLITWVYCMALKYGMYSQSSYEETVE